MLIEFILFSVAEDLQNALVISRSDNAFTECGHNLLGGCHIYGGIESDNAAESGSGGGVACFFIDIEERLIAELHCGAGWVYMLHNRACGPVEKFHDIECVADIFEVGL